MGEDHEERCNAAEALWIFGLAKTQSRRGTVLGRCKRGGEGVRRTHIHPLDVLLRSRAHAVDAKLESDDIQIPSQQEVVTLGADGACRKQTRVGRWQTRQAYKEQKENECEDTMRANMKRFRERQEMVQYEPVRLFSAGQKNSGDIAIRQENANLYAPEQLISGLNCRMKTASLPLAGVPLSLKVMTRAQCSRART